MDQFSNGAFSIIALVFFLFKSPQLCIFYVILRSGIYCSFLTYELNFIIEEV